jgi:uncharacterized protein (TIGR02001 family)
MKKLILATAVAAACISSIAQAQEAAAPVPDNALSFNIGVVNDYRFRGISQTRFDPAIQGGVDYVYNPLGLYAGAWASNIKWIKDGVNILSPDTGKGGVELDIYGGKRGDIGGGFTYDVGGLYYYYPNNNYSSVGYKNANTFELYGQIGYDTAYFKVSNAMTNAFGNVDSKNSRYYDLSWNPALAGGVTLGLHIGHQTINGSSNGVSNSLYSYTDWKVGISKTFDSLAGITAGIAYVGTDAKDGSYITPGEFKNLGRSGVVVSLAKTF